MHYASPCIVRLVAMPVAPNGLELRVASPEGIRAAPRDCEGQLLGGSGNG